MISVQYLGHSTCSKSPPIWHLPLFLKKTIIKWQYWMVHSGREVILQCQGFRNKVFVIEIPRELGRSSFNQSAMRQRHKTHIPQSDKPVCTRNIFDVSNPEKVVFIAMFRSIKILEIYQNRLYVHDMVFLSGPCPGAMESQGISSIWPQALVQPREWKTTCWAAEWKSFAK